MNFIDHSPPVLNALLQFIDERFFANALE